MPDEQMLQEPNQETPTGDSGEDSQAGAGTSAPAAGHDEYFLDVDERHRYRTKEDAARAVREAGERISQLSRWEKEIGATYGISDPVAVRDLIAELLQQQQSGRQAPAQPATAEQLSPEMKWLREANSKLGYLSKEETAKLEEQLRQLQEQLQGVQSASFEEKRQTLATANRSVLRDLFTEAKIPQNPKTAQLVEMAVAAWVNASEERRARYYSNPSSSAEVIKEGFREISPGLLEILASQKTAYAKDKTDVTRRSAKPLPKGESGSSKEEKPRARPTGGASFAPEVHDRAWEIFQKAIGSKSEEQ